MLGTIAGGTIGSLGLVAISASLLLRVCRSHPRPRGKHRTAMLRARLPCAPNTSRPGLFVQVTYPSDGGSRLRGLSVFPYFRADAVMALSRGMGYPLWLLQVLIGGRRQVDPSCSLKPHGDAGWPIVIFSSGLWGCCEMYTQFCREIASLGFIVLALEHEDGSGVYAVNGNSGMPIHYKAPPPPSGPGPVPKAETESFRRPFLEQRRQEYEDTAAVVAAMANAIDIGISEENPESTLLAQVLRGGDNKRMVLVGHSFGAAGALFYLRRSQKTAKGIVNGEMCPFRGTLLADLWGAPLPDEDLDSGLPVPFALLLSEEFARSTFEEPRYKRILAASRRMGSPGAAVLVPGTKHQWVSDSHVWMPAPVARRVGIMGTANYVQSHSATIRATEAVLNALAQITTGMPVDALQEQLDAISGIIEPFGSAASARST